MRLSNIILASVLVCGGAGLFSASRLGTALAAEAPPAAAAGPQAVGPQYDTTHVYVAPEDVDRLVASFLATFGGSSTKQVVATVTPTPSSTSSQLLLTPVGNISLFGFRTPVPYPFGLERTGYLVRDIDAAVRRARTDGAGVLVTTFPDPIGKDAVIQWPGGVNMQLYWHTAKPSYAALQTVPENRVYISPDKVTEFVRDFVRFSLGKVVADDVHAPGVEIGRPGDSYHRIRIESGFGRMVVMATDGHLPYPFGHELTGYEVGNLAETLDKAKTAGASVLAGPYSADDRQAALVTFPGGYIAEIHAMTK
jgi:predicted enzyme related to lactoylglutathione lyase